MRLWRSSKERVYSAYEKGMNNLNGGRLWSAFVVMACLQVATSHIDFGLGHVTYFGPWDISWKYNANGGLKKHLLIGACSFWLFPWSLSTAI